MTIRRIAELKEKLALLESFEAKLSVVCDGVELCSESAGNMTHDIHGYLHDKMSKELLELQKEITFKIWEPMFKDRSNYNIFHTRKHDFVFVDALKNIWPEGCADELNFCLFGTSGIHGSYGSIDRLEASCIKYGFNPSEETNYAHDFEGLDMTFLIVHPRIVALRYGNVRVTCMDDIEYLKKLRDTSAQAVKEFLK